MRTFSTEPIRLHIRLLSGLATILSLAGLGLWQLVQPAGIWPLALLDGIDPHTRGLYAIGLLTVTLIVALDLVRRHVLRPVRQLVEYIKLQHGELNVEPPQILQTRTDEIGTLAGEIRRLLITLKAQRDTLLEQTLYDPLTGLGNRRLLEQRLDIALSMTRRSMQPISALMIDVDHFKPYNDYYGHPAGDDCLQEIAHVLRDTFRRETDILIRLGGEEFLAVLLDIGVDESQRLAEAMRGMLQMAALPHARSPTAAVVTVSIGVATAEPGTPISAETLIANADAALYQCKSQGRNQSMHRLIKQCAPIAEPRAALQSGSAAA